MKKEDLIDIASKSDNEIVCCPIFEKKEGYIRFEVDPGLCPPTRKLYLDGAESVIRNILRDEQIDYDPENIVKSSFQDSQTYQIGADVMWKTFVTCFAEHRPLVLSPDMIWLLICQTIADHVKRNAEALRDKFVDFKGQMNLAVRTTESIYSESFDWTSLFSQFYDEINKEANAEITSVMINDFSTTGPVEKMASVATLMGAVESYFHYDVFDCVCGIPHITLLGNVEDWKKVESKAKVLSKIGLDNWLLWLEPILSEFVRTAEGKPNLKFWQSIVLDDRPSMFDVGGACIPSDQFINGWCVALFPFKEGRDYPLDERYVATEMDSELLRVGFDHHTPGPDGRLITTPMELWAGFVGVDVDEDTHAMTPKIGWFVRKSTADAEETKRLQHMMDEHMPIELRIKEVPTALRGLPAIECLRLNFMGKVNIPDWLDEIDIDYLEVSGQISPEECDAIKRRFPNCKIVPIRD